MHWKILSLFSVKKYFVKPNLKKYIFANFNKMKIFRQIDLSWIQNWRRRTSEFYFYSISFPFNMVLVKDKYHLLKNSWIITKYICLCIQKRFKEKMNGVFKKSKGWRFYFRGPKLFWLRGVDWYYVKSKMLIWLQ